jgi:NAD(P)H dehydrogenase (quinone)
VNHLIIYSHPNPRSFNHAILETYEGALREAGHEVRVRDLYAEGFDPVLKGSELATMAEGRIPEAVQGEQAHVAWADVLTFIYPLWWAGPPAIAKGYLDRVFSAGFAYSFGPDGLQRMLTDKKVATIVTIGDTQENYREKGFFECMDRLMDEITFDFSGIQPIWHHYFGAVPLVSNEERGKMLDEVRALATAFPA